MNGKWVRWVAIGLGSLPALVPLWLILTYGVDVPYWDQWDKSLAGLYIKAADGQLSLSDFTAQHNEHRIIVPRTVAFVLNWMTGWNTRGEMLFQWVLVCCTSGGLLWLGRQTVGGGKIDGRVILLWFLSNLMLFTLKQHENWLWGMGLVNVMPPLFLISAIAVMHTSLRVQVRVGLTMLFCAGAMFSLGSGVLAFPVVGMLWAWSDSWKQLKSKRTILLVWAGGFAVCLAMFIYGYSRPAVAAGLENKVVSLGDRLGYLLTFLGTQFQSVLGVDRQTASMAAGLVLLMLVLMAVGYFLYLWLRSRAMKVASAMLPWCLIGLFVVFSAMMATVFRTIVGTENAMSSRYVTFTLYLPVVLIHLVPLICRDLRERFPDARVGGLSWPLQGVWLHLPSVLATTLVMAHLYSLPSSFRESELMFYGRLESKAALLLINVMPNNPKLSRNVYPDVNYLRQVANRLDQLGYLRPRLLSSSNVNLIRDTRYDSEEPRKFGMFERMGETSPGVVTASGWAMWPDRMAPADAIVLTYETTRQEQLIFAVSEGIYPRNDLAATFKQQRYELAGWMISFAVGSMPAESSTVRITAWGLDAVTGKARPLWGQMNLVLGPQAKP